MIGPPYRQLVSPSYEEDELWESLDVAIEGALKDPVFAWNMVWLIVQDARRLGYKDVQSAAERILDILQ